MIDASIGNKPAPMLEEFRGFVKQTSGYGFAVTLAEPYYVKTAAEILHPLGKKVCTVLSYPLAGMTHETKMLQAVSYTHLDVYKRQGYLRQDRGHEIRCHPTGGHD